LSVTLAALNQGNPARTDCTIPEFGFHRTTVAETFDITAQTIRGAGFLNDGEA
jgi:hypothetical protein